MFGRMRAPGVGGTGADAIAADIARKQRAAVMQAIEDLAAELFPAGENDSIMINELKCTEPGCPPVETVIALLESCQGKEPRKVKIYKPLIDVTGNDVREAFNGHTSCDNSCDKVH